MDWFRMYGEFASDAKVQSMSEAMQRRFIMLLCLRCSNSLETLQDEEIAFALRIDEAQLVETKALFVRKNFIDAAWNIVAWDTRQYASDSSAARVARHRAAKKEKEKQACNVTESVQNRTEQNRTDTEKNKSKAPPPAASVDFFADVDPQVAADFKQMRTKQRAPITATVMTAFQREAAKAGMSIESVLTLCCVRNWRGFQAAWVMESARGGRAPAPMQVAGLDHSSTQAAMAASMKRMGTTVPDGEIEFN
jgi:hypothetical protein